MGRQTKLLKKKRWGMLGDYYTQDNVLNDEEIELLKSIAEPNQIQAGIGGSEDDKSWIKKGLDKLKRNSTIFWFKSGDNSEADKVIVKVVNTMMEISHNFYGQAIQHVEPIQYTRYGPLHHYGWHMDSGFVVDGDNQVRVISASLELDDPKSYGGGGLEFRDHPKPRPKVKKGTITCFPSLIIHRARPVFWGSRSSLVMWGGFLLNVGQQDAKAE